MNTPTEEMHSMRTRLLGLTALAAEYCVTVENAAEDNPDSFVASMIRLLPRLYMEFTDIVTRRDLSRFAGHDDDDDGDGCVCSDPECGIITIIIPTTRMNGMSTVLWRLRRITTWMKHITLHM